MKLKFVIHTAILWISCTATSFASSEAGLDVSYDSARVRVLYSVALDYEKSDECVRDPRCMLFEIVAFFQNNSLGKESQQQVLQFDLYQSSKKIGNYLSLAQDPFEGGHYKVLYDGSISRNIEGQVTSLLYRYLKLRQNTRKHVDTIRLYKCVETKGCNDILFGAFPSAEMHSGYCIAPSKGCDSEPILLRRDEMQNFFPRIP